MSRPNHRRTRPTPADLTALRRLAERAEVQARKPNDASRFASLCAASQKAGKALLPEGQYVQGSILQKLIILAWDWPTLGDDGRQRRADELGELASAARTVLAGDPPPAPRRRADIFE